MQAPIYEEPRTNDEVRQAIMRGYAELALAILDLDYLTSFNKNLPHRQRESITLVES